MQMLSIAEQCLAQRYLAQLCFQHAKWLWRLCPWLHLNCVDSMLKDVVPLQNWCISVQPLQMVALNGATQST